MRILLLTAPMVQLNTPYPATAYLAASCGCTPTSSSWSRPGRPGAGAVLAASIAAKGWRACSQRCPALLPRRRRSTTTPSTWATVDAVVQFLQGRAPKLAARIVRRKFLPRAALRASPARSGERRRAMRTAGPRLSRAVGRRSGRAPGQPLCRRPRRRHPRGDRSPVRAVTLRREARHQRRQLRPLGPRSPARHARRRAHRRDRRQARGAAPPRRRDQRAVSRQRLRRVSPGPRHQARATVGAARPRRRLRRHELRDLRSPGCSTDSSM